MPPVGTLMEMKYSVPNNWVLPLQVCMPLRTKLYSQKSPHAFIKPQACWVDPYQYFIMSKLKYLADNCLEKWADSATGKLIFNSMLGFMKRADTALSSEYALSINLDFSKIPGLFG